MEFCFLKGVERIVMNKVFERRLGGQIVFQLVKHLMLIETAVVCIHSVNQVFFKIKSTNPVTAGFDRKVNDWSHVVGDFSVWS
jgi:hypothetical protein